MEARTGARADRRDETAGGMISGAGGGNEVAGGMIAGAGRGEGVAHKGRMRRVKLGRGGAVPMCQWHVGYWGLRIGEFEHAARL